MIRFSWKFIQKLLGMSKEVGEFQDLLLANEQETTFYSVKSEAYVDVRSTLTTTPEQEQQMLDLFGSLKSDNPDETVIRVADYVNNILTYAADLSNFGKVEYWASPYEVLKNKKDDCDGYALLILKAWQLLGVPASRRLIWCGDIFKQTGEYAGGHAVPIYLRFADNEWYSIEGSYFAEESRLNWRRFVPLWSNSFYGKSWFVFNEEKSYAGTRFIGGKKE